MPAACPRAIFTPSSPSPPYFNLRDYLNPAQVGRENAPGLYIQSLVEIFREVRRTLRPDGSLWLNIGDSYARGPLPAGIKKKDLIGIPWMLAFALRQDGWHLRSDVIWTKPNGTPESVKDRPSRCHEYVFLLTKTARYFYDRHAVMEPNTSAKPTGRKAALLALKGNNGGAWAANKEVRGGFVTYNPRGRNRRTVWSIPTASFRPERVGVTDVDHFALFPPALVRPCVLAGTSAGGCCRECGCPWRRLADGEDVKSDIFEPVCRVSAGVARSLRGFLTRSPAARPPASSASKKAADFTGLELNPDYARLGQARLDDASRRTGVCNAS